YELYGWTLRKAGRRDQARPVLAKLVAIREKVAAADRNNAGWQHRLATGYIASADNLYDDGEVDAAAEQYRTAPVPLQPLTAIGPGNAEWKNDISVVHSRIATGLRRAGRFAEAMKLFEQAMKEGEEAAAADPGRLLFQSNLIGKNSDIARTLWAMGRPQEA